MKKCRSLAAAPEWDRLEEVATLEGECGAMESGFEELLEASEPLIASVADELARLDLAVEDAESKIDECVAAGETRMDAKRGEYDRAIAEKQDKVDSIAKLIADADDAMGALRAKMDAARKRTKSYLEEQSKLSKNSLFAVVAANAEGVEKVFEKIGDSFYGEGRKGCGACGAAGGQRKGTCRPAQGSRFGQGGARRSVGADGGRVASEREGMYAKPRRVAATLPDVLAKISGQFYGRGNYASLLSAELDRRPDGTPNIVLDRAKGTAEFTVRLSVNDDAYASWRESAHRSLMPFGLEGRSNFSDFENVRSERIGGNVYFFGDNENAAIKRAGSAILDQPAPANGSSPEDSYAKFTLAGFTDTELNRIETMECELVY